MSDVDPVARPSSVAAYALALCAFVTGGAPLAAESKYQIAFTSFAPFDTDLYIADADGANARAFLSSAALEFDASFSIDGRWVLFSSTRDGSADIYRAHPDGSALERLVDDPAYDAQASLSPNGRTLAFVSSRSGQADIWLLDLKTKKLSNLTQHPAGDFRPAWSPDGKWLAFSTDRDSKLPHFPKGDFVLRQSTEIYVVRVDGRGLKRVTRDDEFAGSPSWSADGRKLAFYTARLADVAGMTGVRRLGGTTQIETLELASGTRAVLTSDAGEKWAPRWLGRDRIGFASGNASGGIDFTAGPRGARGVFRQPSWSRDGQRLIFQRDALEAWPPHRPWMSLDPQFSLLRVGVFASYSPAGDRRVSNDQSAGLAHNSVLVMNAAGEGAHVIFRDPEKNAMAPVWSHQGDRIAFSLGQFFQGLLGASLADIAIIDVDGANFAVLTDGKANYALPSWSPDGKRVVYRRAGLGGNALQIIDVATRAQNDLLTGSAHYNFPAWSPTADRIAFTSDMDGDYEIYAIDADGTNLRRLTHSPWNDAHASWSPDGAWLAFTSGRGGFKDEAPLHPGNTQPYGEICVMRADGSDVRVLTDNPFEDGTPVWIPGGR